MAKRRRKNLRPFAKTPRTTRRRWAVGLALLAGAAATAVAVYRGRQAQPSRSKFAVGPVTACRAVPAFAKALGYNEASVLDTQGSNNQKGLLLADPPATPGGKPQRVYRHPTWEQAGYLGPFTSDKFGNVYVAPAPRVNLYDNPPDKQNTVYKVGTASGAMAALVALPAGGPLSPHNPYGVLGLAYDCDTHSLYVSSVAGSTAAKEIGRIYRINPETGAIVAHLDDVDAFGLGVFNGASGKRLFYGSARASEVRSVALTDAGHFAGAPRLEVSLVGWGPEGDDKARRIMFDRHNVMLVRGMEFEFNLIATSERRQTDYRLTYDPIGDGWKPVETYRR